MHRYTLDKTSRKFRCPSCGQKTYVLYVDNGSSEYLDETVGKCDRLNHCSHHLPPRDYFEQTGKEPSETTFTLHSKLPDPDHFEIMDLKYVEQSLDIRLQSSFAKGLVRLFGEDTAIELVKLYLIGRSRKCENEAVVFWRIDVNGCLRTGKIMNYDPETLKRKDYFNFAHCLIDEYQNMNYLQCFFGEHLLGEDPERPVAIVESEKTAIVMKVYFPQFTWIATGGKSGCKWRQYSVYKVLQGRSVFLYPDFGWSDKIKGITCYQAWKEVADHIRSRIPVNIQVGHLLENYLPESKRDDGEDILDYFLKRDPLTGRAVDNNGTTITFNPEVYGANSVQADTDAI